MHFLDQLASHFDDKRNLFEQLLTILDEEAAVLKTGDVTPLWALSEKKQAVGNGILEIRKRLLRTMDLAGRPLGVNEVGFRAQMVLDRFTGDERLALEEKIRALNAVKGQVRKAGQANLSYVATCLDVVGDMVGAMARSAAHTGYDRNRQVGGSGNVFVSQRV